MNASFVFMAVAFVVGALIPVQVAVNAQLGAVTKSPISAGLIIFLVGTVAFVAVTALARPPMPSMAQLATGPKTIWLGGFIAALYILSAVIVAPKLGVGLTTVLIVAGQLLMALLLDHFGAFGNPEQSINLWRLAGAAMIVGGVVVIKLH
jgi:transporter family-2 protein